MSRANDIIKELNWICSAMNRLDATRNLIRLEMEPTDQQWPIYIMHGGPVSFPGDDSIAPTGPIANDISVINR